MPDQHLEDRVRRGLASLAEAVPLPTPTPPALDSHAQEAARSHSAGALPFRDRMALPFHGRMALPFHGRMALPFHGRMARPFHDRGAPRGWAVPLGSAAAVAVLLLGVTTLYRGAHSPPPRPATATGDATVPTQFEDASSLTATVDESKGGRAIVLLNHRFRGHRFGDDPQTVVVGADRDTYRLLRPADMVFGLSSYQAVLSPDGTKVAIAAHSGGVDVLDLRTGEETRFEVTDKAWATNVYAFSPDGRYLACGSGTPSPVRLLDLRTGAVKELSPQLADQAAFSPDGSRIAIQLAENVSLDATEKGPRDIVIVGRAGNVVARTRTTAGVLAGAGAWSPDGRYLATADGRHVHFLPVAPGAPHLGRLAGTGVVGWRSADEVLLQEYHESSDGVLVAVSVRDSGRRVLSKLPTGTLVDSAALGLLPELGTRQADDIDFGPWPGWLVWPVTGALGALGAFGAFAALLMRRWRRREPG